MSLKPKTPSSGGSSHQRKTSNISDLSGESSRQVFFKHKENDPTYKGENIDRNLIHGPIQQRNCTNFICCFLLCGVFFGDLILSIAAFVHGDPYRLAVPIDSTGTKCGHEGVYFSFPYAYLVRLNANYTNHIVCVNECPSEDNQYKLDYLDTEIDTHSFIDEMEIGPETRYNTQRYGRACLPYDTSTGIDITPYIQLLQPKSAMEQNLGDLRTSWGVLVGTIFVALFIGYVYLMLMRRWATCMTYAVIVMFELFLLIGGALMLAKANNLGPFEGQHIEANQSEQKAFGVLFLILAIFFAVYLCCNHAKIRLGITLISCSVDFSHRVKRIFFVPLVMFILYILFLILWTYAALFIYSYGKELDEPQGPFEYMKFNSGMRFCLLLHFIAFLIISDFLTAIVQFLVSSATCHWYYFRENEEKMKYAIRLSSRKLIKHIGSLAYGAFVISPVQLINMFLRIPHACMHNKRNELLVQQQNVHNQNKPSCCTQCCVSLSESYEANFRFINEGGYIQVALTGVEFWQASHNGYYLMRRNLPSFKARDSIGSMMLVMGRLFVCVVNAFVCYLAVSRSPDLQERVYSPVLPVIYVAICSYFIGNMFVSVYSASADTILHCYSLDEELHNEIGEPPKYVPATLQQFLDDNQHGKAEGQKI